MRADVSGRRSSQTEGDGGAFRDSRRFWRSGWAIVCACTAKECAKIRHGRAPGDGYRAGDACLMWRRAAPNIIEGPSLPAPAFTGSVIRR
jgi:hypothetical protein